MHDKALKNIKLIPDHHYIRDKKGRIRLLRPLRVSLPDSPEGIYWLYSGGELVAKFENHILVIYNVPDNHCVSDKLVNDLENSFPFLVHEVLMKFSTHPHSPWSLHHVRKWFYGLIRDSGVPMVPARVYVSVNMLWDFLRTLGIICHDKGTRLTLN